MTDTAPESAAAPDHQPPDRDALATAYFDSLRFEPYPIQEEALLAWFTAEQGVLVCAPTGTGKTLIAEAALYEALKTDRMAYYTTPLIALTEQKFRDLQQQAVQWGFAEDDVGLVTGNRRQNPDARILVVVAEILFNRLLRPDQFEFDRVSAVVMDEFHSFSDPERGIVWELTLGMLPAHIRLMLLSATVGNAYEFTAWLRRSHNRDVALVQGNDRKVPLEYQWVGDQLLSEQLEKMAAGDDASRRTPALVFCFNREECWTVAEHLKGKKLLPKDTRDELAAALKLHDWTEGVGPKLKQVLQRGIGVHHAGVLPKYRRIVEDLFQRKLLSVAVCTETLAAGINLPARSVVLPGLLKGPPDKKIVIPSNTAHQIFGRAGRPQFDDRGFVYSLAHEDDVKIARWREKFDQIPEKTKDPGLMKAKKALKRKMPKRRTNFQYWNEQQFQKLQIAPPGKLASKGPLPWRLLAYMLEASPEVQPIRELISKRLLDTGRIEAGQKQFDRMLKTLWRAGYVQLDPPPPLAGEESESADEVNEETAISGGLFSDLLAEQKLDLGASGKESDKGKKPPKPRYQATHAYPTERLAMLGQFRSVNPLYGVYLINQLGIASRAERIQALESALEFPMSVGRFLRVPGPDYLPPGPLATMRLGPNLLKLGLATAEQLGAAPMPEGNDDLPPEDRVWRLTLAEQLLLHFNHDFPEVDHVRATPVWAAGRLQDYGGSFDKLILGQKLQKQEGIVFRHLLRLVLLIAEFQQLCPPETTEEEWQADLRDLSNEIAEACRRVDATGTEKVVTQILTSEQAS